VKLKHEAQREGKADVSRVDLTGTDSSIL